MKLIGHPKIYNCHRHLNRSGIQGNAKFLKKTTDLFMILINLKWTTEYHVNGNEATRFHHHNIGKITKLLIPIVSVTSCFWEKVKPFLKLKNRISN